MTPVTHLTESDAAEHAGNKQVLELRTYALVDRAAEAILDRYLEHALVPALSRQGLGPIGVFDQAEGADGNPEVMLLVPGPSVEAVTAATAKLATDSEYLKAAKDYLEIQYKQPIIKRIRSELLMSFDCWPQVVIPKQQVAGKPRLFELRIYESATEHAGETKVDMFNSGEVPIFLDSGIAPVFMGQALIGEKMPNLTYMTVYDNDAARGAAWKTFVEHPDWHKLKAVKKYQDTVSKIHKSDWVPKSYSQL
ncbi:MAG: NIPSNAP family protein [Planctomycetota bacterium]